MQALHQEGLASYFTRHNADAAARLWHELLRLTLAASQGPHATQLYFLSDFSTAAVMQQWPEHRVSSCLASSVAVLSQGVRGRAHTGCRHTIWCRLVAGCPHPLHPLELASLVLNLHT